MKTEPAEAEISPRKDLRKSRRTTLGSAYKEDARFLPNLSAVQVIGPLGTGANGIVYKGSWDGKIVAIKSLGSGTNETLDEQTYSKFLKEGKLMLGLKKHVNLIDVYAICYEDTNPAIIMEYAERGTLISYLQSITEVSTHFVYNLVIGIAKGLRHLHRQDVIHRDIAARNILLKQDFTPMVSDFGLSREIEATEQYSSTGQDLLPVKWMAPEAIRTKRFSTLTDIWSFGIVVWEIITVGAVPHGEVELMDAMIQIRDHFATPPIPTGTDETLVNVMKQCWYQDPDMRPSAKDIVDMVNERDL